VVRFYDVKYYSMTWPLFYYVGLLILIREL